MKTELIFFDSNHQSKNGTLRGLIAFVMLVGITALWFFFTYKPLYKKSVQNLNSSFYSARTLISSAIIYILLCSALAVQLPTSWDNAMVYGLLVGLVVFSIANLTFVAVVEQYSILSAIVDTIFGTVLCGVTSVSVYYISKSSGWYS